MERIAERVPLECRKGCIYLHKCHQANSPNREECLQVIDQLKQNIIEKTGALDVYAFYGDSDISIQVLNDNNILINYARVKDGYEERAI